MLNFVRLLKFVFGGSSFNSFTILSTQQASTAESSRADKDNKNASANILVLLFPCIKFKNHQLVYLFWCSWEARIHFNRMRDMKLNKLTFISVSSNEKKIVVETYILFSFWWSNTWMQIDEVTTGLPDAQWLEGECASSLKIPVECTYPWERNNR